MRFSAFITICVLLALFVASSEAGKKKLTKSQKKNIRMFKKLKKQAQAMEDEVKKIKAEIEAAEKLAEVSDRHVVSATGDALVVVDAEYTGNGCGPFTLTSWTTNLNIYIAAGAVADSADPFSSGTFTSPVNAWYHICSFSRFKNSGNSNDVTILSGGSTVLAAYGNAITYDWRSTGICIDTVDCQASLWHTFNLSYLFLFPSMWLVEQLSLSSTNLEDPVTALSQPIGSTTSLPCTLLQMLKNCVSNNLKSEINACN